MKVGIIMLGYWDTTQNACDPELCNITDTPPNLTTSPALCPA